MHTGRVLADEQRLGDLAVGPSKGQELEHVDLAWRETELLGLGALVAALDGRVAVQVQPGSSCQRRDLGRERRGTELLRGRQRGAERCRSLPTVTARRKPGLGLAPAGVGSRVGTVEAFPGFGAHDPGRCIRLAMEP